MRCAGRRPQTYVARNGPQAASVFGPLVGCAGHGVDMTDSLFDKRGVLLRRDALARGLDDNWLGRMVRSHALIRMRQGAYADPRVWQPASPSERHDLRSWAVMRQYDDRVALSHVSGVVRRGGPTWGLDLSNVHLTNLFGRGDRTQAGVTHHRGTCLVIDVSRRDGHWITSPARNAMETAVLTGRDSAVAVLDWFMNQSLATREDCRLLVDPLMREWAGTVDLSSRLDLARAERASVGETRTGLFLHDRSLVRQGEPDLGVVVPRARPARRPQSAGCGQEPHRTGDPHRHPPAGPGGTGRRGRRCPPDPGLPVAADRPAAGRGGHRSGRQRQEGAVPGAARHAARRRQADRGRGGGHPADRARLVVRLPQPRRGHARVADDARAGASGRLRRHPQPAVARRRRRRDRPAWPSTSRRWPAPGSPPASTACSWRSTRTRRPPGATPPTPCASTWSNRCWRRLAAIDRIARADG